MNARDQLQQKYNFDPENLVGKSIGHAPNQYLLKRFQAGAQGRRGYTYEAFCEATNHRVCCKLYFSELLDGSPNWVQEFTKPNRVQSDDIAHYVHHGSWEDSGISFTWIFYQWIDGVSLRKFIEEESGKINISFVLHFARWILGPLSKMKQANSVHGDIHTGNIMVTEGGEDDVPPRNVSFKLIDFGISASMKGLIPSDDYKSTAAVLAQLLKRIPHGELSFEGRFFLRSNVQTLSKVARGRGATQAPSF